MTQASDTTHLPTASAAMSDWDRHIGAFVKIADDVAAVAQGPLAGRTVAVKDVIDVAGLPTCNGSRAFDATPAAEADAPVVARLRAAGARIIGKTVTTEFAFTDPTPCRNPYSLEHSPGGSSSGSGAAVGARVVDIALGTQTAGSLIRPAAYCGAVGFKAGRGVLPMGGVTPLSPTHDMVGVIALDVPLAAAAFAAMAGAEPSASPPPRCAGRLILSQDAPIDSARLTALDAAAEAVAGHLGAVAKLAPGIDVAQIVADHRTVMCAEAAAAHGWLLADPTRDMLMPNFRDALLAGQSTAPDDVAVAMLRLAAARAAFWQRHAAIDVIVTPPVPQGPPRLGTSTGYQHWLTVWTVLGGPLICLPWGLDAHGLPISVMLAGRPGQDSALLRFGQRIARHAPPMPAPTLPRG
jgi:Asp-tRNA(Asn)/Glu-tRNA(Gln) amidotransferase A subunit family amidase